VHFAAAGVAVAHITATSSAQVVFEIMNPSLDGVVCPNEPPVPIL
jgi:hypothetical protein